MSDAISQALLTRAPLQWRKKTLKPLEMKAPRYQQDYSLKKDIDPDKDRYSSFINVFSGSDCSSTGKQSQHSRFPST